MARPAFLSGNGTQPQRNDLEDSDSQTGMGKVALEPFADMSPKGERPSEGPEGRPSSLSSETGVTAVLPERPSSSSRES